MKEDRLYLSNIKECIDLIEAYTLEGKEAFLASRLIQDAVIRHFEVIGEATKRLSLELKQAHPDIPWPQIPRLRDILSHDYLRVNVHRIWGIIEQNIPHWRTKVKEILQDLESEEENS